MPHAMVPTAVAGKATGAVWHALRLTWVSRECGLGTCDCLKRAGALRAGVDARTPGSRASLWSGAGVPCAAGGVADALREGYNDQLRDLRSSGLADTRAAGPLREALRALRDQPRPADGAVKVCRDARLWTVCAGCERRSCPVQSMVDRG